MNKFKPGQKLQTRSTCDNNCIYTGKVVSRTAKTIMLNVQMEGIVRRKIEIYDNTEIVYPFGKYSMCPIFRADR